MKLNPGVPRHKQHSKTTKNGVLFTRGRDLSVSGHTGSHLSHVSFPTHRKTMKPVVSTFTSSRCGYKKYDKTEQLAVHICNKQHSSLTSKSACFKTSSALILLRINSASFATRTMWSFIACDNSLYGSSNNIYVKITTELPTARPIQMFHL